MASGAILRDTSPSAERLCLEMAIPAVDSAAVFRWWIDAGLICQWWPTEATITASLGGEYHLAWPAQGWHLRGRFLAYEPGKLLTFTWTWDHDPDVMKTVEVVLSPLLEGGTLLTLTHSSYSTSAKDGELRASHLAGWQHFLPRLWACGVGEGATT